MKPLLSAGAYATTGNRKGHQKAMLGTDTELQASVPSAFCASLWLVLGLTNSYTIVASAMGPDRQRRDAGDALSSPRNGEHRDGPMPPQPSGPMGVAGDLVVTQAHRQWYSYL